MNRLLKIYRSHFPGYGQLHFFSALSFRVIYPCSSNRKVGGKASIHIEPRSSWKAMEANPYKTHAPVRITVHHEGTKLELADDAAKKDKCYTALGDGAR